MIKHTKGKKMNELLNLIMQINENTNYLATLRYIPSKINGHLINNLAVDLMLNDENVYHKHIVDEDEIENLANELRERINRKTKFEVYFSDGVMGMCRIAQSKDEALSIKDAMDNKYGIDCKVREIIDG